LEFPAGAILLLMVLESIGLSLEAGTEVALAYAGIRGIDAILDMDKISLNNIVDLAYISTIAQTEKVLDLDFFTWSGKS